MNVLPKYYLNIGLANSDNYPDLQMLAFDRVVMAQNNLPVHGFSYIKGTGDVVVSSTELTLIMAVHDLGNPCDLHERFTKLALALGQDCIAVRDESGHGELFGEHPWGAFDHSLFITPKV